MSVLRDVRRWALLWLAGLVVVSGVWAGELPSAKPEAVGLSAAKLAEADAGVEKLVEDGKAAGAVVMVARKGKIAHFEVFGLRDIEAKKPMERDTIMRFYSMSKPITSVAAMILYEEGKFKLDDAVGRHVPELKGLKVYRRPADGETGYAEAKRQPTVRDLMRHTSGFTYGIFGDTPVDRMYREKAIFGSRDLKQMAEKLGGLPLMFQPGARWHYGVSTDMLGYLVERVSGQRLDEFFEERIFKPLDMRDTGFYVPAEKAGRFSRCYGPNKSGGLRETVELGSDRFLTPPSQLSGGGGLVSTARDYMRFCQMLLNKGRLGGVRILKAETVEMMTRNQLPADVYWAGRNGFGLGFSVQLMEDRSGRSHVGEYGWGGAASTHFWISPKDELAVVALSQYMPFSGQLQGAVKSLIYAAIEE